jgi:hypothetical protein
MAHRGPPLPFTDLFAFCFRASFFACSAPFVTLALQILLAIVNFLKTSSIILFERERRANLREENHQKRARQSSAGEASHGAAAISFLQHCLMAGPDRVEPALRLSARTPRTGPFGGTPVACEWRYFVRSPSRLVSFASCGVSSIVLTDSVGCTFGGGALKGRKMLPAGLDPSCAVHRTK